MFYLFGCAFCIHLHHVLYYNLVIHDSILHCVYFQDMIDYILIIMADENLIRDDEYSRIALLSL